MLYREPFRAFLAIFIATLGFAGVAVAAGGEGMVSEDSVLEELVFEVSSNKDLRKLQRVLDEKGATPLLVKIAAGEYRLKRSLHVNRSNVTIQGEAGARLKLAKKAQAPVIAVGSQSEYPLDAERIENVSIYDLEIDGNREFQESEYNQERPWIRNNGIDARTVTGLRVERVVCGNNRSGGLVISWRCRDVVAKDCVFKNNYFDGVAYYDSVGVFTVDCLLSENLGAGVSIDNAVSNALFANCRIEGNRDVGVFARHSEGLMFYKSVVKDSGNWAFFLSHDERQKGVFDVEIASCEIVGNHGGVRMGSVNTIQSAGNRVTLSVFSENGSLGRPDLSTAGAPLDRLEGGWNPEVEYAEEGAIPEGPFSKRLYQTLNSYDALVKSPES
ncbi:right-handed parallel beta-helix repeat-containing protein [Pelagicoccus sp. SDUM812005]|uniref:right-handed parallel beta-helix repeat-containing protein n=1 Tax=Pelagicoccus sp. SDUM812005 TaxID=3041257 RepID=UPI00280FBAA9|nr:right-handed parallel beta-helix repeat-containing protein [Pelagicoccus sp. SDUM812005]MDQ8181920.1 right-handed parallel beta-helix repeat-containing protein [Pelagicoccus sp. SDUM812005]